MSTSNKLPLADYRLKNINNALYVDGNDDVVMRTGFAGNIVISGNVNVPGDVTVITDEDNPLYTYSWINHIGTSGDLTVPWMPVAGNVTIDGNANVVVVGNIAGITTLPAIHGNVNVDNFPSNVSITQMPAVTGNVHVYGNVSVDQPVTVNQGTDPWIVSGNVTTSPSQGATDYFGTPEFTQMVPYVQINSYEGIKERETQVYTGGGGTVAQVDPDIRVSSTTTVGSYAVYRSRRFIPYRAGQSCKARILAQMDSPSLGTQCRIGIANQESGYYIGYNGANDSAGAYNEVKFLHTYGGRAEIWELEVTGTASGTQTVTVTLNGTAYTVNIASGDTATTIASKITNVINSDTWLTNSKDNLVEFLAGGALGPLGGTFSVADTGNVTYTLTKKVSGVIATSHWSGFDSLPAWVNLGQYVTWQFQYSWSGVEVYVLDVSSNQMALVHRHGLNDDNSLPVRKPSFKPTVVCYNVGGSSAAGINVGYLMGAVEGIDNTTRYTYGGGATKTSLAQNQYHHIMSIQNPYVDQNYNLNFRSIRFRDLTTAVQGNDPVELYIVLNSVITNTSGTFDWAKVDGRLYQASMATGTVDMTDNTPVVALVTGITGSGAQFNLTDYELVLPPGDHMSLVAYSTAAIQKISIAGTWGAIG